MDGVAVTFGLINRNGEETLADCLRSVSHLVDEIIVVDTGSTDNSVAVARTFGATVIHYSWPDDYSAARNVYVEAAHCPFILSLDSDEVLPTCTRDQLQKLLRAHPTCAFRFAVHNYFFLPDFTDSLFPNEVGDSSIPGLGISPSHNVRLFPRRPGIRYCYPVHESVTPTLRRCGVRTRSFPLTVQHLGFLVGRERVDTKRAYYRKLGYRKIELYPNHYIGYYELAKLLREDCELQEARSLMTKCLSLSPFFVPGSAYAALLALRAEDWRACATYLRQGLSASPGNLNLLYVSALLESRRGKIRRAIKQFSEIIHQRPQHFASSFHLANLLIGKKRYRQAEQVLLRLVEHQPMRGEARLLLAELAARQGDYAKVESVLSQALQGSLSRQMRSLVVGGTR